MLDKTKHVYKHACTFIKTATKSMRLGGPEEKQLHVQFKRIKEWEKSWNLVQRNNYLTNLEKMNQNQEVTK